ncbi:MAG: DNA-methyltransferase [Candidatus Kariarchaeaceae archaeon]|jgi:site-specific DNA-methyltransferase (adenine-specific)
MKKGTSTRSFGSSKRERHDSSVFYESNLYQEYSFREEKNIQETPLPHSLVNSVLQADSRDLKQIPDNSVHLVITSPPYNVSKDYDVDLSLREYLSMLKEVMQEVNRVLIRGGRVCINVANVGRKPYIPLSTYINSMMIDLGFFMRGEIIWNKAASAGTSTAWGSWQSASSPTLRDVHEYILIYSKGEFSRKNSKHNKTDTISKDDFLESTKSIWTFPTASAKKVGHPAPFPVELPKRLIEMYSFAGDVVLDPFSGAGTTAIAAIQTSRNYIMVDIDKSYCQLAKDRIATELA